MVKLFPIALVLLTASFAGVALRWVIEPPTDRFDRGAMSLSQHTAAEKSLPIGYGILALAGLALACSERWSSRIAGGLLALGSGMVANVPWAIWLLGTFVALALFLMLGIGRAFGRIAERV
jgi:hypothetical protein